MGRYCCYLKAQTEDAKSFSYNTFSTWVQIPSIDNYSLLGSMIPLEELKQPLPFGYKELITIYDAESVYNVGDIIVSFLTTHEPWLWMTGVIVKRKQIIERIASCHYPTYLKDDWFSAHLNYDPCSKHFKDTLLSRVKIK